MFICAFFEDRGECLMPDFPFYICFGDFTFSTRRIFQEGCLPARKDLLLEQIAVGVC